MSAAQCLYLDQSFWLDQMRVVEAENRYQEFLAGGSVSGVRQTPVVSAQGSGGSSLVNEIAKARAQIKQSLDGSGVSAVGDGNVVAQIQTLQAENRELRKVTEDLAAMVRRLEGRVAALEVGGGAQTPAKENVEKPVSKKEEKPEEEDDDDDDFELFGDDDSEDEAEKERIKQERVDAYNKKKAGKAKVIAKSSVVLDVKPWDDETDMKAMENQVRTIEMDGLVWGASKLMPLAFGIKKLQIMCVVEDDKVSIDELSEKIEEFEDYVQSVDIAAFNKI